MRRAAKVDRTQAEIVAAAQAIGAVVVNLSAVGRGVPDLAVLWRGRTWWVECKDGALPPSARKLTPAQEFWHGTARSRGVTPIIAGSGPDLIQQMRAVCP
jgi:hypothetical protein